MASMDRKEQEAHYAKMEAADGPVLYICFEGTKREIPLDLLQVSHKSSDKEIRTNLAEYLDVAVARLARYGIERHKDGGLSFKVRAIF